MRLTATELPPPRGNQVLLRQTVIGFNFIDIYHRSGRYPLPLPTPLGVEAVGVVAGVGEAVSTLRVGDRVIYKMSLGAYAEHRLIDADEAVSLPDAVGSIDAAALFTKALTAEFLLRRLHRVAAGETLLVYAAAGGVGGIVAQWGHHLGAHIIGVVGSANKASAARANGCDAVIISAETDVARSVAELIEGRGVDVAYDSIGRDTFESSISSLRPRGLYVSYGSASGMIAPFDFNGLAARGAPFLTRASINTYYQTREQLEAGAELVFDMLTAGTLQPRLAGRYDFENIVQCHRDAEARRHAGSAVITTQYHTADPHRD